MLVKERMSRPVITIFPESTMQDALNLMKKEHVRRLPVVNHRGELIGIVTETDLDRASPSEATTLSVWEIRELISKVKVEKIMARDVVTIEDTTPIEEAARIMSDSDISGLPVMHDGKLVGLITETDLFKVETDLFKVFLELFGARYPGVRLTIEVPRGPGQLAKITQAILEKGGDIVALGTFLGESAETGTITVKVNGIPKAELIQTITPMVLRVLDVRDTRAV